MASHWGANDQVDGYTSKFWGVFMMPLMTLGMMAAVPGHPKYRPAQGQHRPVP
jgi:hypothetical protein